MDSGAAVPTLSRGVSTTSAVNVWTRARGGVLGGWPASAARLACARLSWIICAALPYFDSLANLAVTAACRTFCTAGSRTAIMMARMMTTTSNSVRVNARRSMGESSVGIEANEQDKLPGRQQHEDVTERRNAGPVSGIRWFGPII